MLTFVYTGTGIAVPSSYGTVASAPISKKGTPWKWSTCSSPLTVIFGTGAWTACMKNENKIHNNAAESFVQHVNQTVPKWQKRMKPNDIANMHEPISTMRRAVARFPAEGVPVGPGPNASYSISY